MSAYQIFRSTLWAAMMVTVVVVGYTGANEINIGVIDSDRLIAETEVGKKAKSDFMTELTATRNVLFQIQKRIKIIGDSLALSRQIQDEPPVIEKQEEKLQTEIKKYKQIEALLKERLRLKDVTIAQKLRKDVNQIIQEHFIDKKNYCLIVEKADTVAICDRVDVTDELIEILNALPPPKIEDKDQPGADKPSE